MEAEHWGIQSWGGEDSFPLLKFTVAFKVSDSLKSKSPHMDLRSDHLDPNSLFGLPSSFGDNLEVGGAVVAPSPS